jgi:aspartate kinase
METDDHSSSSLNDHSSSRLNRTPRCVVMKFGGTSVEDSAAIRRAGVLVRTRLSEHPVVVVSAMAKVTDQLLNAAKAAAEGAIPKITESLQRLSERHLRVARELLDGENCTQLCRELQCELDLICELTARVQTEGALSPQLQDHLLGVGETLSSKIFEAWLRQVGVDAVWVDGKNCIVTDAAYTRATPLGSQTNDRTEALLAPLLQIGRVPVLGGFVGATPEGVPTTLGRGGSDFSAALLGAALHAQRIEIWTDVDGVMTTDPNLCRQARSVSRMSFEEAADLAYFGAKVLHPSTLVPAMASRIPVHVLNSSNPEYPGTEILPQVLGVGEVKAIAVKDVAIVNVDSMPLPSAQVLEAFERHRQDTELISASRGRLALLVNQTAELLAIAKELKHLASVRLENHKALVSLVGEQIRCRPEIASQALGAIRGLDARLICLGISERSISFLIDEPQAIEAVRHLHTCFFPKDNMVDSARPGAAPFYALCQAGAWH